MSTPAIRFDDVVVLQGNRPVLRVPAFALERGSLLLVVGDNGAGKTSLLLAAAGLLDLGQGRIELFGQPFHRGRAPAPRNLRRRTAVAFQEPYLFADSVRFNVELGLRFRGLSRQIRRNRVDQVIERLGLSPLVARRAGELSGGERKLVSLAAAAVLGAELLLLDEPLAGLDEGARARVLELVTELVRERGASVLLATHALERIGSWVDGSIRIEQGELAAGA